MANEIVPSGTGLYYLNEAWPRTIERNVFDVMDFATTIMGRERLFGLLHLPKISRATYTALAQSATGAAGLTYSGNSETEATLSPTGIYVADIFSRNQLAQSNMDQQAAYAARIEDALAEGVETIAQAQISSLTTYRTGAAGASIDASLWRSSVGKIPKGARSQGMPGKADIHIVVPTGQWPSIMGIDEFTHADIVGGEQRTVKGIFVKAAGATLHMNNVLPASSGSSKYGSVFLPGAFGISWNERISSETQKFDLSLKLIGYCNFGVGIVWDNRAVRLECDDPS